MQRHEIALHGKLAPVDLTLHKRSNLIFYNATIINYSSRKNCTKMANEIGLKIRNGEFDPTHNTKSYNIGILMSRFSGSTYHVTFTDCWTSFHEGCLLANQYAQYACLKTPANGKRGATWHAANC
ncbi:hypothetical protein T01_8008 [Trichinella spiralis]|uniref:Uncharacterized protein n=1 Tax=Trichinella spiralis TaxID=6334 RepID=A0A0V1C1Q2_TRISP|nr:hypothetical protein T01_8008 [Trichinella spiralis]